MKTLGILMTIFFSLIFLTITSGCFTTFHSVKRASAIEDDYYMEDYAYNEDEYIEETTLEFRPSRFIVETRYFDYGNHLRKVKYVAYDYDPWYDPYPLAYYDGPTVYINIHWGFGFHYYHRPWGHVIFHPGVYFAWGPIYPWYEPWCGYPVYYPVWYPAPVYYPYPVPYHPPYYAGHYYPRNYKKRDWDRRQQKVGSRIAKRRTSPGYDSKGSSGRNKQSETRRRLDKTDDNKRFAYRDRNKTENARPQARIDRRNYKKPEKLKTNTEKRSLVRTHNRKTSTRVTKENDQKRQKTYRDTGRKSSIRKTRESKNRPQNNNDSFTNKKKNKEVTEQRRYKQQTPSNQRNTSRSDNNRRVAKEHKKQNKTYDSRKNNRSQSSQSRPSSYKSNNSRSKSSKSYQSRPSSSQQKSKSSSSTKKDDNKKRSTRSRRR